MRRGLRASSRYREVLQLGGLPAGGAAEEQRDLETNSPRVLAAARGRMATDGDGECRRGVEFGLGRKESTAGAENGNQTGGWACAQIGRAHV